MKLIDSDKFLQDMADLYRQAGWDEREVHFSLADLRFNISMEDIILIPRREPDMVPVIRCKDCKWYYIGGAICARYEYFHDDAIVPADGYCFRAERKDNG